MEFLRKKKDIMFLIAVRSMQLYYNTICSGILTKNFRKKLLKGITQIIRKKLANGIKETYILPNKKKHREDGPAYIEIINNYKDERWFWNDKLHRIGDEPATIKQSPYDIIQQWWYLGRLHRLNGPATIEDSTDKLSHSEGWWIHGINHREDGPAYIYRSGSYYKETWLLNGKFHRIGEPAILIILDEVIVAQDWFKNGESHREDGPASIQNYRTGERRTERWLVNGQDHRLGGPSFNIFRKDGTNDKNMWFVNGVKHREDGPAFIQWALDGINIINEEWWLNGNLVNKDDVVKLLDHSKPQ